MSTKKQVQANYSQELISAIVAEYASLIEQYKGDNKLVLQMLSDKYGKTIPSIRAKLSSLKVYKSANSTDTTDKPIVGDKTAKKEDIANAISNIVGVELVGLEAATKAALQSILVYLLKISKLMEEKDKKIDSLIAEMLDSEPVIVEDINDND